MDKLQFRSNCLLFITAAIWGLAFVAQRVGMDYVGPFTFNGVRFVLGGFSLVPLIIYFDKKKLGEKKAVIPISDKTLLKGGSTAGLLLFGGASLQQMGLIYTTAGSAGFLTGLYVVLVPIMGMFIGERTNIRTWIGAVMAVVGLYFLSVKADLTIGFGDLLVTAGSFLWAAHVLLIGKLSPKTDVLKLSLVQFLSCAFVSFIASFVAREDFSISSLGLALVPILYAGLMSVGVAYTLQVVAQQNAHPAHAAIILSLESVFALAGGCLLLNETISFRGLVGCAVILAGMLISQLEPKSKKENSQRDQVA